MAIGATRTAIPFKNSLLSYWTQQLINDSCLFFASDNTDILNKVAATHLPNQVTGSSDFLTVTGTGLNARYRTPDSDTYRTADSDNVFWKTDASESICDGNRLIAYDFPRILVKYLNVSPYTILWIAILKPGVTVTDGTRDAFDLSIWWSNTLSFHGNTKQNRLSAQSVWTPERVAPEIPTGLTLTLISGGVKIDWTDTNGGEAETEIWGQDDGAAYALLWTIAAGTVTKSETITPVDLRYYKIRAKIGANYSDYTAPVSIAMLDVERITNVTFDTSADWVLGAGWTISGGTLNSDGSGAWSETYIPCLGDPNVTVKFIYDIISITGIIALYAKGKPLTQETTTGHKVYVGLCSAINTVRMVAWGNVTIVLDNISMKNVLFP